MDNIKKAADIILGSKKVFALTGAGISTDSGIPDFRSGDGYYTKMDPTLALSKDRLLNQPELFYKEGYMILLDLNNQEPNGGHIALAQLEKMGHLDGIITQNIDNLHAKAGSKNIYEVHGETRGIHCMSCGSEYDFPVMKEKVDKGEIPPLCDKCGGVLRPNVVMFGDMMPDDFSRGAAELENTDTLIVVGSSLTVSPVNFLPNYVDHLIIINNDRTPADNRADVVINDNSTKVLSAIVKEIEARK
ncbi:NAD-dependent deacetylase [Peptoniphilus olsenii]|mgnify:CR=1 FL=1|uniref:protein acetyllysine N-acetyltransferase n=1 Tax=Peptoniphilus olsenii TaxID=411570 RepID=A0ABV2J9V8_9FIRM